MVMPRRGLRRRYRKTQKEILKERLLRADGRRESLPFKFARALSYVRALRSDQVTTAERLVLYAITTTLKDLPETNVCFPSKTELAATTSLHRRTVIRAVQSLKQKGIITTLDSPGGRGRTTAYQIWLQPAPRLTSGGLPPFAVEEVEDLASLFTALGDRGTWPLIRLALPSDPRPPLPPWEKPHFHVIDTFGALRAIIRYEIAVSYAGGPFSQPGTYNEYSARTHSLHLYRYEWHTDGQGKSGSTTSDIRIRACDCSRCTKAREKKRKEKEP